MCPCVDSMCPCVDVSVCWILKCWFLRREASRSKEENLAEHYGGNQHSNVADDHFFYFSYCPDSHNLMYTTNPSAATRASLALAQGNLNNKGSRDCPNLFAVTRFCYNRGSDVWCLLIGRLQLLITWSTFCKYEKQFSTVTKSFPYALQGSSFLLFIQKILLTLLSQWVAYSRIELIWVNMVSLVAFELSHPTPQGGERGIYKDIS